MSFRTAVDRTLTRQLAATIYFHDGGSGVVCLRMSNPASGRSQILSMRTTMISLSWRSDEVLMGFSSSEVLLQKATWTRESHPSSRENHTQPSVEGESEPFLYASERQMRNSRATVSNFVSALLEQAR